MQNSEGTVSVLDVKRRQVTGTAQSNDLMPIREAAARLNVSEMTIRRAFDAGDFPGLQFGRTYRVSRPFVDALLKQVLAGRRVVVEEFARQWLANSNEATA